MNEWPIEITTIVLCDVDMPVIAQLAHLVDQMKTDGATAVNDRAERPSA